MFLLVTTIVESPLKLSFGEYLSVLFQPPTANLRKWRNGLCSSLASESLGPLATQVVDTLSDGGAMAWGDLPEPMAMSSSKRQKDRAFVE